jgi:hypothetical protein
MNFLRIAPFLFAFSAFAGNDPTVEGRWRLDLSASNVQTPLQSETLLFEKSGTKFRLTANSAVENRTDKLIVPCDGKQHLENNAGGAACDVKDHGRKLSMRIGGAERTGLISPDGNTLLMSRTATGETLVYRRD